MLRFRWVALDALALFACSAALAQVPYSWKSVAIGGGGYVTGVLVHPKVPDLVYVRTDVGGAYRWESSKSRWVQLFDWAGMDQTGLYGVEGMAIDPNRPDVVYAAVGQEVYADAGQSEKREGSDVFKSEDRGKTWRATGLHKLVMGNGDGRWFGESLMVDPRNSDIVYCGTRKDGLFVSHDGAKSWSRAFIPEKAVLRTDHFIGIRSIAFGAGSETKNRTRIVYAAAYGIGIYRSADGGRSFHLMPGAPVHTAQLRSSSSGVLYASGNDGLHRYQGHWTDITPVVGMPFCGLTIDPRDPTRLITGMTMNQKRSSMLLPLYRSHNEGKTWEEIPGQIHWESAPGWYPHNFFAAATSALAFDPHHTGKVFLTDWYATWWTPDVWATPAHWYSSEQGHEETYTLGLASPPQGPPLFTGMADDVGFRHTDLDKFPAQRLMGAAEGSNIVYVDSDPRYMAMMAAMDWDGKQSSFLVSADSGITWKPRIPPPGPNAKLAYSSTNKDVLVSVPRKNTPYYTSDGGKSWRPSNGAPSNIIATDSIFNMDFPLAADLVDGTKFYLFHNGHFFRSKDSGATWQETTAVHPLPAFDGMLNVKSAPGVNGLVWVSLGANGLWRSANSGDSFERDPFFTTSRIMGWGIHAVGSVTPTAYVYGMHSDKWGVYRSTDAGINWQRINDDEHQMSDDPRSIEGDRQVFGRVYLGSGGRGVYYGVPSNSTTTRDTPVKGD